MNWLGIGGGPLWETILDDARRFGRRLAKASREPEEELPDADLPAAEQRRALNQEAARRMLEERSR